MTVLSRKILVSLSIHPTDATACRSMGFLDRFDKESNNTTNVRVVVSADGVSGLFDKAKEITKAAPDGLSVIALRPPMNTRSCESHINTTFEEHPKTMHEAKFAFLLYRSKLILNVYSDDPDFSTKSNFLIYLHNVIGEENEASLDSINIFPLKNIRSKNQVFSLRDLRTEFIEVHKKNNINPAADINTYH